MPMKDDKKKWVDRGLIEESAQEQIEREWLLFKQINRINEAQSVGSMFFIAAVETLEINLWPELQRSMNKDFRENIVSIETKLQKEVSLIRPTSRGLDPREKRNMLLFEAAKSKFKILMLLMDKENLLPIKKANYYEMENQKEETRLIKKLGK